MPRIGRIALAFVLDILSGTILLLPMQGLQGLDL